MNLLSRFRQSRRFRLGVELAALGALGATAYWLWSAPARREKEFQSASLQQLVERVKREPKNARLGYWIGVRRHQLGDFAGACQALRVAGELDGDDEDIWLAWSSSAGAMGATQEAFSVLSTFTKAHPSSEQARLALAIFYHGQDSRLRALEEAQAVTKLNPKNAVAWRLVGSEALELRRLPEAQAAFEASLRIDPTDWRSQLALGNVFRSLKRDDQAQLAYEKTIKLAPGESIPRRALGRLKLEKATTPEALKAAEAELREVIAREPSDGEAFLLLGQCLTRQSRRDEALVALEKAGMLSSESAKIFYELSRAYLQGGDKARADAAAKRHDDLDRFDRELVKLKSQIAQVKDDVSIRLKLARLLASQGHDAEAAREYRRLIVRDPRLVEAQKELTAIEQRTPGAAVEAMALPGPTGTGALSVAGLLRDAQALLDAGRYDQAQRAFARALTLDPKSAGGYTGLGLALLGAQEQEKAFQALQKAVALDPKQARALYGLAALYLRIGFPDEAIRRLESALVADPGDAECHYLLGVTLRDVGRTQAAEDALKKAVARKPAEGRYRAHLAWVQSKANNTDDAHKNFDLALVASPKDSVVLGLYGGVLAQEVQKTRDSSVIKKAEKLLKEALVLDKNNFSAQYSLGDLYLTKNSPKEAVPYIESAIESNPKLIAAWYRLSVAYTTLGNAERSTYCRKKFQELSDYELARSSAEEQARTNLKDPVLRLKLARLYVRGNEAARALSQYAMYLSLKPADMVVARERAALIESLKKQGNLPDMEAFETMLRAASPSQKEKTSP